MEEKTIKLWSEIINSQRKLFGENLVGKMGANNDYLHIDKIRWQLSNYVKKDNGINELPIVMQLDDGSNSQKGIVQIVHMENRLLASITPEQRDIMKAGKYKNLMPRTYKEFNVKDFLYVINKRYTNSWGRINGNVSYFVNYNEGDESVYVCNEVEVAKDKVILYMEWGDYVYYPPERLMLHRM